MFLFAVSAASTAAAPALVVHPWLWVGFCAGTAALLLLDMFVFHGICTATPRESCHVDNVLVRAGACVQRVHLVLGPGPTHAIHFITGYLVEWSLSMDNVFVFVVIFAFFGVPLKFQYRVLFWGILVRL